jgi:RNA-directed DNA polymerase
MLQALEKAYRKVKSNRGSAGVDHVTLEMFEKRRVSNLQRLHDQLREGSYRPQAIRRTYIPKPGRDELRPLGIPTVRDRVVQTALRNVLEPIFERDFGEHSYGFRPGRGCKGALRSVDHLLKRGYRWVVDVDLKSYLDTIPHGQLLSLLRQKVADNRVLQLVEAYLDQQILEGTSSWSPEAGTPQGAVASPLLANIYLDPLDHLMAQEQLEMIRYADDLVVLCKDEIEAQRALSTIRQWTESAGLTLHPTKTRIVDLNHSKGFEFLGYHFEAAGWKPSGIVQRPREKSLRKFKDKVRLLTKRNNGHSMATIIASLNPVVRGFFEYFKHVHPVIFGSLDGWIRMRLRSTLRRRVHRRGRGRGTDHRRWPNAFFGELGLFFMAKAWAEFSQPRAG